MVLNISNNKNKVYCLIIILFLIIVIATGINKYFNTQIEHFNSTPTSIDLTGLGANPLIERGETSKITVNPGGTIKPGGSILLGTSGKGWIPFDKTFSNSSLIIDLGGFKRVTHIVTTGIKAFRAFYSKSTNDAFSYEEILYKTKGGEATDPRLYFEICVNDFLNLTKFTDLITADGAPIFASFIKIVPISFSEKSFQSLCINGIRGGTVFQQDETQTTEDVPGMKLEIFGYKNDAKPITTGDSLLGISKVYDELGIDDKRWKDKTSGKDPRIKILFFEGNNSVTKQINSIKFDTSGGTESVNEFSITYKLENSNINKTINNIKGNTTNSTMGDNRENNIFQYYFEKPIIASEIIIKPTKPFKPVKQLGLKITDILGFNVTKKQSDVIVEKSRKDYCSATNESSTEGSVTDLLSKQSEIQQLCDSLELQDQIKENNLRIQKNKQYLVELDDQDKKIAALEEIVEKMKHTRAVREKNNDHNMIDQKDKQSKIEDQLKQLVSDRQKNLKQLNVHFKLNDKSLNKMEKFISTAETINNQGNNTDTTPIEAFTNYNKQIQIQSQTQSQNQNQNQNKSEYYNQGFYYRPYADETVRTQIIESSEQPSTDLRLYQFNNQKFETVQPMKSYENQALKCTSGCDINTKFIKKTF
jgi:hypothetical protein